VVTRRNIESHLEQVSHSLGSK